MKQIKIILIVMLCSVTLGYGQILAYEFTGYAGNEASGTSVYNEAALTSSTITRGSGLTAVNNNGRFNGQSWALTSIANAVTGNDYMEFTITPTAGFQFDVTTISFNVQRSATGLRGLALRSSVDGYAANIDSERAIADITNTTQVETFNVNQTNNTAAITYRIYGYAEAVGGSGGFEAGGSNNNDIYVEGSISAITPVTCIIIDDFSTGTLGAEWTDVGGNASIVSNQLSITGNGSTTLDYIHQDVTSIYNTYLSTLPNVITWEFNMQQSRANPTGLNNTQYSAAFVLGGTSSDLTEGNGYAVLFGNSTNVDNVKLISYTGGMDANSNITDIIVGGTDYGRENLSIGVTYDPASDTWELFVRNDGLFFSKPISLTAADSQGTAVNTTYTNSNLDYIAAIWKHRNTNITDTATFDNICIATNTDCTTTASWDGSVWTGTPDKTADVTITGNYNTTTQGGGFSACTLTVDPLVTITVDNNFTIEVEKNVINNGTILVETNGSFVQNNENSTFTNNNLSRVVKTTAPIDAWYEYTYWSSPVVGELIGNTFFGTNADRRFWFNAANFQDSTMESMNNNDTVMGQDDVDDNSDDWQIVSAATVMSPGVGYVAALSTLSFSAGGGAGSQFDHIFDGAFNNGIIRTPVVRNDTETADANWNLIGNPYPSAIYVDLFFAENVYDAVNNTTGTLDGAIYLWSQNTAPSGNFNGNSGINVQAADYAVINGMGQVMGGEGVVPTRHIPSGQGFFASFSDSYSSTSGDVVFRNSMRVSGNNNQFFRTSNATPIYNKMWLDLTLENGAESQILVGYVNGATADNDGSFYDATRNASTGSAVFMYSTINNDSKKFAIQGKSPSDLNINETIPLGLYTSINTNASFTISIHNLEGDFFNNNTIYLRDYATDTIHNLSDSDYTFNASAGDYSNRFEIVFNNNSLSTEEFTLNENSISIIELSNDNVKFSVAENISIKYVKVYDVLGRQLYSLKGNSSTETYTLSNLKQAVYIAQIELSNGQVISKKAIKK